MWNSFEHTNMPDIGKKVVIIADRGNYSVSGYVTKRLEILDAEEGYPIHINWFKGTLWTYLPDDYPLHFMEQTEADWY